MKDFHGLANTKIYKVWQMMKDRCINKNSSDYHHYGGRGISVCNEWINSFKSFYDWAIKSGYDEKLTIDRIDNDGNYCPENCRWSNIFVQRNNTRKNHFIEYKGQRKTISQWARKVGLGADIVRGRIVKCGWSIEKALTTPNCRNCDRDPKTGRFISIT